MSQPRVEDTKDSSVHARPTGRCPERRRLPAGRYAERRPASLGARSERRDRQRCAGTDLSNQSEATALNRPRRGHDARGQPPRSSPPAPEERPARLRRAATCARRGPSRSPSLSVMLVTTARAPQITPLAGVGARPPPTRRTTLGARATHGAGPNGQVMDYDALLPAAHQAHRRIHRHAGLVCARHPPTAPTRDTRCAPTSPSRPAPSTSSRSRYHRGLHRAGHRVGVVLMANLPNLERNDDRYDDHAQREGVEVAARRGLDACARGGRGAVRRHVERASTRRDRAGEFAEPRRAGEPFGAFTPAWRRARRRPDRRRDLVRRGRRADVVDPPPTARLRTRSPARPRRASGRAAAAARRTRSRRGVPPGQSVAVEHRRAPGPRPSAPSTGRTAERVGGELEPEAVQRLVDLVPARSSAPSAPAA